MRPTLQPEARSRPFPGGAKYRDARGSQYRRRFGSLQRDPGLRLRRPESSSMLQHSFAVATLCNRLAAKENSGLAYMVGLCHDLGEILFHSQFVDEYQQCSSCSNRRQSLEPRSKKWSRHVAGRDIAETVKCLGFQMASHPDSGVSLKGTQKLGRRAFTRLLDSGSLRQRHVAGLLNESPLPPITCADATPLPGTRILPTLTELQCEVSTWAHRHLVSFLRKSANRSHGRPLLRVTGSCVAGSRSIIVFFGSS